LNGPSRGGRAASTLLEAATKYLNESQFKHRNADQAMRLQQLDPFIGDP